MKLSNTAISVFSALGAAVYITLVAELMNHAQSLFDNGKPDTALAPIAILMLLVLSVATVGSLLFGRGFWLFFQGKKQDGLFSILTTLATFFVLTIALLLTLGLVQQ